MARPRDVGAGHSHGAPDKALPDPSVVSHHHHRPHHSESGRGESSLRCLGPCAASRRARRAPDEGQSPNSLSTSTCEIPGDAWSRARSTTSLAREAPVDADLLARITFAATRLQSPLIRSSWPPGFDDSVFRFLATSPALIEAIAEIAAGARRVRSFSRLAELRRRDQVSSFGFGRKWPTALQKLRMTNPTPGDRLEECRFDSPLLPRPSQAFPRPNRVAETQSQKGPAAPSAPAAPRHPR